jgi:DNA-binding MarR family transcriptional regulator
MTAKQIAEAATMDAPATTVALNDLEDRGLIVREADPTNRRSKLVSLTDEGREVVATIDEVEDPAPPPFATLNQAELRTLETILAKLAAG